VFLPVEREGGSPTAAAHGLLDGAQRLGDRGGAGEVDSAQAHARVREMGVGVDEGRQHQGALEVYDRVHDVDVLLGALLVADPAEPVVDDHEGRRGRPVGGADPSAAVEGRRHGRHSRIATPAARRRASAVSET